MKVRLKSHVTEEEFLDGTFGVQGYKGDYDIEYMKSNDLCNVEIFNDGVVNVPVKRTDEGFFYADYEEKDFDELWEIVEE